MSEDGGIHRSQSFFDGKVISLWEKQDGCGDGFGTHRDVCSLSRSAFVGQMLAALAAYGGI